MIQLLSVFTVMTVLCNCSCTTYAELNGIEMINGCSKYLFDTLENPSKCLTFIYYLLCRWKLYKCIFLA